MENREVVGLTRRITDQKIVEPLPCQKSNFLGRIAHHSLQGGSPDGKRSLQEFGDAE